MDLQAVIQILGRIARATGHDERALDFVCIQATLLVEDSSIAPRATFFLGRLSLCVLAVLDSFSAGPNAQENK